MWIVPYDPFLIKKLLKSQICGSINSARYALIDWKKINMHSTWTIAASLTNAWKKEKRKKKQMCRRKLDSQT